MRAAKGANSMAIGHNLLRNHHFRLAGGCVEFPGQNGHVNPRHLAGRYYRFVGGQIVVKGP